MGSAARFWCGVVLGSYFLAYVLSPSDPLTLWLLFALICTVAVFARYRLSAVPCNIPRQFSLRMLLAVFVLASLLLAFLVPYVQRKELRSSSDNVISFSDEQLAQSTSVFDD